MVNNPASVTRGRAVQAAGLLVAVLALAGCANRVTFVPDSTPSVTVSATSTAPGLLVVRVPESRPPSGINVRTEGGEIIHIPPGHYPPPGQCRIWRPGVPPGQQDRPGSCGDLERLVPAGAYLVYG